jgi:antitoxin HicB
MSDKGQQQMATALEYLKKPYGRLLVPEDDGTYRAEIVEFPGCFAVGDTAAEAVVNLENAAESWLESTIAKGQTVPEPMDELDFSGKLVVRLPRSLHKRAAYAANRNGVSLNQFIVNSVAGQVGYSQARLTPPQPVEGFLFNFSVHVGIPPSAPAYQWQLGRGIQPEFINFTEQYVTEPSTLQWGRKYA